MYHKLNYLSDMWKFGHVNYLNTKGENENISLLLKETKRFRTMVGYNKRIQFIYDPVYRKAQKFQK